jgi:hypothetical protein
VIRAPSGLAAIAILLSPLTAAAQNPPPPEDDDVEIPAQPAPAPSPRPGASAAPIAAPPTPGPSPAPSASPAPAGPSTGADGAAVAGLRHELAETRAKLDARIEELERRAAEKTAATAPSAAAAVTAPAAAAGKTGISWLDSLVGAGDYALSAYVQAQYENHQDSQDQLQQGGGLLNQDRFLVRRGRLRFDAAFPYTELALELDGNTTRGPAFGVRRAEASLVYRARSWDGKLVPREEQGAEPPLAMLTFGLTEIPFGFELTDSSKHRVFMERSQASLAFFPGEPDVGARLSGGIDFFRYALAVMNGQPLNDRSTDSLRDPNSAKDFIARVGVDALPLPSVRVSGGVSALYGTGFHPGEGATKGAAQWRDLNENSAIDPGEVTALPGSAAAPSRNFDHWALGLDLQVRVRTPIGTTFLYAEAGAGQNLDRGLFVADPVTTGVDVRHLYYYAAWVQEVTRWGLVGFRAEAYDPNADFFDNRLGKLLPASQTIHTLSPLVGLAIPGRAKLVFQYDVVIDGLGRDDRGVPADLKNDRFTLRLQVEQ